GNAAPGGRSPCQRRNESWQICVRGEDHGGLEPHGGGSGTRPAAEADGAHRLLHRGFTSALSGQRGSCILRFRGLVRCRKAAAEEIAAFHPGSDCGCGAESRFQ
ncbi:unnamed protein product, partial [Symbiodinium sp. KB8]